MLWFPLKSQNGVKQSEIKVVLHDKIWCWLIDLTYAEISLDKCLIG